MERVSVESMEEMCLFLCWVREYLSLETCRDMFPRHNRDVDFNDRDKPYNYFWSKFLVESNKEPALWFYKTSDFFDEIFPILFSRYVREGNGNESLGKIGTTKVFRLAVWFYGISSQVGVIQLEKFVEDKQKVKDILETCFKHFFSHQSIDIWKKLNVTEKKKLLEVLGAPLEEDGIDIDSFFRSCREIKAWFELME